MKNIILFLICVLVFFVACKKKKVNGDVDAILEEPKQKQLQTKTVTTVASYVGFTYFYDSEGRLDHTDILYNYGGIPVTETYTYNASGRMIKSASPKYINYYVYDSNNHITQHTRVDQAGKRDSVTFIHRNDSVIGLQNNSVYLYFVKDTLKKIFDPDFAAYPGEAPGIEYVIFYSSTPDPLSESFLKSYDILTLADFVSPSSGFYFAKCEIIKIYDWPKAGGRTPKGQNYHYFGIDKNGEYPAKLGISSMSGSSIYVEYGYYY